VHYIPARRGVHFCSLLSWAALQQVDTPWYRILMERPRCTRVRLRCVATLAAPL
jgi:hypothetical protein